MAFLNNLGKKIGSAAEATASKAKELAEVKKFNSKIGDQEKQINRLYTEIGKKIFEQDKENPQSPVVELCAEILSSQAAIQELRQKIEEVKGSNCQEEQ